MDAANFEPSDAWAMFVGAAQPDVERWQAALDTPDMVQARRLAQLLEAGRDTAFGRQHGFAEIRSAEQFRERVPIRDTAAFLPWLERGAQDTEPVLTRERPAFFERTSGNTARGKLIPYTPAFLRELQAAMIVWLADMAREHPGITAGRAYWSMSPALQAPGTTSNGIAIGSASDLDYLGGSSAAALAATLLVPPLNGDPAAWRRQTLRALVADETLAMLSVWSPTFLTSLLRPLFSPGEPGSTRDLEWIEANLPAARAAALREAIARGRCDALWPRLAAVSSWMDGPSRVYAESLRTRFPPAVHWLPKGLFATEGVVSIPFGDGAGCPLAIGSHYLEFLFDDGHVCDVSGLALGDEAAVVLTTGGGLYRYALGDRVRVTRFTGRTPCIAFVGPRRRELRPGRREARRAHGERCAGSRVRERCECLSRSQCAGRCPALRDAAGGRAARKCGNVLRRRRSAARPDFSLCACAPRRSVGSAAPAPTVRCPHAAR
ncbi:hypothetical protein GGD41_005270 [Paraburkholderia bryophila]|uniref:GH3 middle domain-containing protein n=1 Tax=Paraburkholderia bryophila TaxID=420952 RepID=A0A7Y9WBZ3_9BURK|nr:hypothetical protein [Paraburkholderia bryophila]